MNVNELADELESFGYLNSDDGLHFCPFQAQVDMLRQQQAEIEMLRQGMKDGFDGLETMTALSKAQADQITRLKLEWQYMYDRANMDSTNKPVAWIDKDTLDATHIIKAVVRREQDEQHTIPLYTHPVKEQDDYCKAYWGNDNKFVDVFLPNSEKEVIRFWNNTHPVKELTDEEIENIAENCWKTDEDLQFFDYNKFAKAILRKAQEK